ncbi:GerA spore germination protein [Tumebacillus sp. BK434]|uniref:spore germination protein n=1 Tax=Tumebacillus sp. BK434 TaxID=2512169 RepID=UPI0010D92B56|nr:spore germination protein [Tumebacillus sp. BK434]TCP57710.1 GerA spore germination protein [Tumebacillus sp. BK434]
MMKLFRQLLKKAHRKPSYDDSAPQSNNLPQGKLGSYAENVKQIREIFQEAIDVKMRDLPPGMITDSEVFVVYIEPLITLDMVEAAYGSIAALTQKQPDLSADQVSGAMDIKILEHLEDATKYILFGWTVFFIKKTSSAYAVNTYQPPVRNIDRSETESVILGPQESFNESLQISLSILRRRIRTPDLKVKFVTVGKFTKSTAAIVYINSIAQQEYIDSVEERLQAVEIDGISDAGDLVQLIDDNPYSPFPQFHMTERPERISSHLLEGKVAILIDGSPFVLSGPASFIEFFQTGEDYSNRWVSASVIRTLRIVGVVISISLSALYVAVVTYHYQMIPSDMLVSLTESRARVPFPPLYETLLMEVTIELLREAGARLPTKVGQTIGIVGGIVLGQAAVSAGFASNILIISVALSTIASFITPSYIMSGALRALRFFLIMFAGFWGLYGLFIGLLLIMIHFLHLTSLGAPYLSPFAPMRISDWKDTFIRAPLPFMKFRPTNTRPRETQRQPFKQETSQRATPTEAAVDSNEGGEQP